LLRIDALAGGDFGHDAIGVTRNALQRDAEHAVHVSVGFGGFKEANAAIVRVTDKLGETFLADFALDLASDAAGAESQPRNFNVGFAKGDPVGGRLACGRQGFCTGESERAGYCRGGFQEFATRVNRHVAPRLGRTRQ
jgi:hypothetical protein